MKALHMAARSHQWVAEPAEACLGRFRARVAEVMPTDLFPGRVFVPAGGVPASVRTIDKRIVRYEKKGTVGIIAAGVQNVGEVYDEIDALLDRI